MVTRTNLLRQLLQSPPRAAESLCITALHGRRYLSACAAAAVEPATTAESDRTDGEKWFTLPPYTSAVDGAVLGRKISGVRNDVGEASKNEPITALKWIVRRCPELPRSLVQKLFRLRQVRRESSEMESSGVSGELQKPRLRRIISVFDVVKACWKVGAKDSMNLGDRIFLPISVKEVQVEKKDCFCNEDEVNFIRSLELYKDPAIIVVNKPPGLPVQGGIGIKTSLDELAISCLSYGFPEPPRLVHRLDRDCSGILVMGRTQTSATLLHSIFREKTFGASNDETLHGNRVLQRKYWALVIGSPRHPHGLITAPLGKVVLDNGKSDRITVINNSLTSSSQHAVTKYKVIASSSHGYTWLELSPLTGRKHQLRVHCAEVLGTPILGDYKYGWLAHRNWKPLGCHDIAEKHHEEVPKMKRLPFGLDMISGSVTEKDPRLHLHSKQMVLPNISQAFQNMQQFSDFNLSQLEILKLDAPLPPYMQRSWDITNS